MHEVYFHVGSMNILAVPAQNSAMLSKLNSRIPKLYFELIFCLFGQITLDIQ
jgi:hypothetical protein